MIRMRRRTLAELLCAVLLTPLCGINAVAAARRVAVLIPAPESAIPALTAMVLTAALAAVLVCLLLRRTGRRIWPCAVIPAGCLVMLAAMQHDLPGVSALVRGLTGRYNLEAAGFYILYGLLICGGTLLGVGLAGLLGLLARR